MDVPVGIWIPCRIDSFASILLANLATGPSSNVAILSQNVYAMIAESIPEHFKQRCPCPCIPPVIARYIIDCGFFQ